MAEDTENFQKDVLERSFSKPVLVDFWAEWCGPCKVLGPVLEKLSKKYNDRFDLVKLNTDHFPEIASEYKVRGIPNVKLFINGEVSSEFTGAVPEPHVDDWIRKNIPGRNEKTIKYVKDLLKTGDEKTALEALAQLQKDEPENTEVKILEAQILLFKDPGKALSLISDIEDSAVNHEDINSVETIADLLNRKGNNGFPEGEVKQEYVKAVELLGNKNFDRALDIFIDIIRNDRSYDDDGARKACIAIFKYLGEEHPVTLAHRRDFGRALYI